MTALSAAYDAKRKDGKLIGYPLAGNVRVFKGALVVVSQSTGLAQTATDSAGVALVGVAYESVDNTGGAAGAKTIRVEKGGSFVFNAIGASQTDLSKQCFIVDDNTVKTAATANSIPAGIVVGFLDSAHLAVRIDGRAN